MVCPSCGCENDSEAVFCDDCGAKLQGTGSAEEAVTSAGPLEPGQLIDNQYKVLSVVHYDCSCGLYEVQSVEQAESHYLMIEYPQDTAKTNVIWEVLGQVEESGLWHPQSLVQQDEHVFLLGQLPGVMLSEYADSHTFAAAEVAHFGQVLLQALGYLHAQGFVHKGIGPNSVWVSDDGSPVLTRFEKMTPKQESSETYSVVEGYSAPEAYGMLTGVYDERSDIYGAGALLYSLLAGNSVNMEARENHFVFSPLSAGAVGSAVMKAVMREPEQRYASALEFGQALKDAVDNPVSEESPSSESASCETADLESSQAPSLASGQASEKLDLAATQLGGNYCDGWTIAKLTNVGAVRKINQDAFLELSFSMCERDVSSKMHVLAVIDGMGGEAEGDKAASLAARSLAQEMVERFAYIGLGSRTDILLPIEKAERYAFILERALQRANNNILDYADQAPERKGMGCTITAAILDEELVVLGHVGDTRGYRFAGEMDQITQDHSVVGQLVQMGALTREQARHSPRRSIIYRALGTSRQIEVDTYHRVMATGEYLMLSSDGVWEYYSDEELLAFFQNGSAPEQICQALVKTCLERGADDNTTVAIAYRSKVC